jgi:acyl-CoA synthetase (AMP-forming)/AMP-acid ligase II
LGLLLLRGVTINTADYLLQAGEPHHPAIIAGKEHYSYRYLKTASTRIAQELMAKGVRPGDRVGLVSANSLFWVASYLAILKLGAIAVPFPPELSTSELQIRQNFVRCEVMCLEKRCCRRLGTGLPDDLPLIFEDSLHGLSKATWEEMPAYDDENQDAVFLFTSGTSGRPRVVRLTHRNIQANTDSIVSYLELSPADRMMVILPFGYCFGASLLHTHLRVGGSLVLSRFLYPESMLNLMQATECTGLAGVPSVYQTLLRNSTFPRRNPKSLRQVQQAGGKLPDVLIQELRAAVPEAQVYIMYGQTEATARLSYLPPALLETKLGSVGWGIPGVTLQVIGDSGAEVKPGEVGEIRATGANISPGYLDDPEASAKRFRAGTLYTGDLATVDEGGFIYIAGRKSDFIKSYGCRVSSGVVEACVLELPEVVGAAAIGVPDLARGEAIQLYVTLRAGSQITAQEIIAHCKQRLAAYMVPNEISVAKNLPVNASGKVVKAVLKQQATQRNGQPELAQATLRR